MSDDILITVAHLSRHYGPIQAVKGVDFELKRGEVLGFLGPNGAGKSTTMQMITGNLAPSAGKITICGYDLLDEPKNAKAHIGYLPEQPPLYRDFTVDEYLNFCARINRMPPERIAAAMATAKERCGLTEVGRRLISNLSKGYQQRVGIAQAIIHSPAIVVLDEPTVGLDPIQIREIRVLIRELAAEHGVILSTHILPEVQMTCDRVQIINRGELVFSDTIKNLDQRMNAATLLLELRNPPAETELGALPGVLKVENLGKNRFRLHHNQDESHAEQIAVHAVKNNWGLLALTPERKTLEQIFVEITSTEQHQPGTEHAEAAA
ncbi:MAG: ABC transporter ATP-binding protein [Gammaproteobacteria bacterium]|nr:ABC transporter ATP-binding protein [Gammaproteobacteria bacterium]MDH5653306.1 ABC transporter ATP-binding protein [Gammaproteobacteria bacterium]